MEIFSRDISQMRFRKVISGSMDQVSLDGGAMKILMMVDETKSGAELMKMAGLTPEVFRKAIATLMDLGLIAPSEKKIQTLDENFLDVLQKEFASIVGPMADVLIDDVVTDMELNLLNVPVNLAPDLINNLAEIIPSQEKRASFQKKMLDRLNQ